MKKIILLIIMLLLNFTEALAQGSPDYNDAFSPAFKEYLRNQGYTYEQSEKMRERAELNPVVFNPSAYRNLTNQQQISSTVDSLLWELQNEARKNTFIWVKSDIDDKMIGDYNANITARNAKSSSYEYNTLANRDAVSMGYFYSSATPIGQSVSMRDKKNNTPCFENVNWNSSVAARNGNRAFWPVAVVGEYIKNAFGEVIGMIKISGKNPPFDVYIKTSEDNYERSGTFGCLISSNLGMQEYLYSSCWLCPAVAYVYDTFSVFAEGMFDKLSSQVITFLSIILAFWILWYVLDKFLNYDIEEEKFWVPVAKQIAYFAIAVGVLTMVNPKPLFDSTVGLMFEVTLKYSQEIIKMVDVTSRIDNECLADEVLMSRQLKKENKKVISGVNGEDTPDTAMSKDGQGNERGMFSKEARDAFVCFVANMTKINARNMAIGGGLVSASISKRFLFVIPVPDIEMFFTGAFLFLAFLLINLLFTLYIIQIIFDIGIVCVMFPIVVGVWCFEDNISMLKGRSKAILDKLIGAAIGLICLSLTLIFAIKGIETIYMSDAYDTSGQMIEQAFESDDVNLLLRAVNLGGNAFLKFIFFAIVMVMIIGNVKDFAAKFGGSVDGDLVKGATGLTGSTIGKLKGITSKCTKGLVKTISRGGGK